VTVVAAGILCAAGVPAAAGGVPQGTPVGGGGDLAELRTDHFKCYTARPAKTFRPRTVTLVDQFGTGTVRVSRPRTLCNPAQKNAEPLQNTKAHLVCFGTTAPATQPSPRTVLVENQFGRQTLTVLSPDSLCVPSTKKLLRGKGRKMPPGVSGAPADHYRCYDVTGGAQSRTLTLRDQFHVERVRVLEPLLLCNPAQKNGEAILRPSDHLTCYSIRDLSTRRFASRVVRVSNQFGKQTLTALRPAMLCVPSLKPAVEPPPEDPPCDGSLTILGAGLLTTGPIAYHFICRLAWVSFLLLLQREILSFEPPVGLACRLLTTHQRNDSLVCEGSGLPGMPVSGVVEVTPEPTSDDRGDLFVNTGPTEQLGPFPLAGLFGAGIG